MLRVAIVALGTTALLAPVLSGAQAASPAGAKAKVPSLARSSFIAAMDDQYSALDMNRDAAVSEYELNAHQRRLADSAAMDRARTAFAALDSDRDGKLSLAEYARGGSVMAQAVDVSGMMRRLDANGDGVVTLVEYRTLTLGTFDRVDVDKDGVLSEAEQRAGGFVP